MQGKARVARAEDIPALRRNWQACFGDEAAYLDFFFSRRFDPQTTLVWDLDGVVVSQLFLLPAKLRDTAGTLYAIDYLFAAATHPDFRCKGYMGQLLHFAESFSAQRGKCGIALLPGEERLYGYYSRFGYRTAFCRRIWHGNLRTIPDLDVPQNVSDEAIPFLTQYAKSHTGIVWDADALQFALDEHAHFRGRYAAFAHGFAASQQDGACLILSEPNYLRDALGLLRDISECDEVHLCLPPDAPLGTMTDGGMLRAWAPIHSDKMMLYFAKE